LSAQNPAIQTIPREKTERNLFTSAPGWKLISCDYVMHEYRTVAYLSDDTWLKQVFREGRDLHQEMIDTYFQHVAIPTGSDARTISKTVNFGLLYGRGPWSLSLQLGMSEAEAQELIQQYFARMPQVKKFMDRQKHQALREGIIETIFGRRRRFGLVTRENMEEVVKQSYNYPVQSTASDLCLQALIRLNQSLDPRVAFPVTILHDAVVVETRDDEVEATTNSIVNAMLAVPRDLLPDLDFPWAVEYGVADKWGDTKDHSRKVS
jgi:DNA polymerase-1